MKALFELFLYQPIFNSFVGLYNVLPDVGLVILVLTLVIKLGLYPLTKKSIAAQKSLADLQPKMEEMKKKYKDDQQKVAQETMKLYKDHKVNPFGSCLPLLIQLPIFLALYWVLRNGLGTPDFSLLYSFVPSPGSINPISLGTFDLSKVSPVLALLAGGAQYWQAKMMQTRKPPAKAGDGGKDENMMAMMNKQMLYFMPVMTVVIGMTFPGGLALYWLLSTLSTAIQQWFMFRNKKDDKNDGAVEGKLVD
jgi:YidC/Oxa1 family membrane protein insertase